MLIRYQGHRIDQMDRQELLRVINDLGSAVARLEDEKARLKTDLIMMKVNLQIEERKRQRGKTTSRWHVWFAWHPVRTLDRRLIWMRQVHRRAAWARNPATGFVHYWREYVCTTGYVGTDERL